MVVLQGRALPVVVRYSLRSIIRPHEKYPHFSCHPERSEGSYASLYPIAPLYQILHCVQDDRSVGVFLVLLLAITSK